MLNSDSSMQKIMGFHFRFVSHQWYCTASMHERLGRDLFLCAVRRYEFNLRMIFDNAMWISSRQASSVMERRKSLETESHTSSSYSGERRSYRACTVSTFGAIKLLRRQKSAQNLISFRTRCHARMALPATIKTSFSGLLLGYRLIARH